jgi:putative membrane protein
MLDKVVTYLIIIPGLLHVYFMYMEMFLWEKPRTLKAFGLTADFAAKSKSLAFNQGLYNGFLAAGLFWSLFITDLTWAKQVQIFFLSCVFLAGVVGAMTVSKKIFFLQSVPALIPLILVLIK